tara:strand:+ start:316 stop:864 length:549 start_codon:yes stop_codon:yes gene_type:complete
VKQLILLRHAKSDWSDPFETDQDRQLNKRGQAAAAKLGHYFKANNIQPDNVLCSSAARTRETLSRIENAAQKRFTTTFTNALYGAAVNDILSLLHAQKAHHDTVLIVAHNLGIQDAALKLTANCESVLFSKIQEKVPTGSLILLHFDIKSFAHISLKSGELHQFIRPKHELIAALNSKKTKS